MLDELKPVDKNSLYFMIICMILFVIAILIILSCGTVKYVVSNQHVQKYGSALAFMGYVYYDATGDAVIFNHRNEYRTYGANYNNWHSYKNTARICLIAAASLKGLEVGQNHNSMWTVGKRSLYEAMLAWDVWQWRKHYVMSGNAFDYRESQNQHLFVLPFMGRDRYLGLTGWKIGAFQFTIGTLGIYGFIIN